MPITRNAILNFYRCTYPEKEAQRRAREFMQQQHNFYRTKKVKNGRHSI